MKPIGAIGLVWIVLSVPAFPDDFDGLAKGIESHYGVRRVSPPMIGFASFLAKHSMWGNGVVVLKFATFENNNRAPDPSVRELDQVMLASLDPIWQPFVRVDSRKGNESVVIYSIVNGKYMTMLVGSVGCSGISLIQIRINPKAFQDWEASPKDQAQNAAHRHKANCIPK